MHIHVCICLKLPSAILSGKNLEQGMLTSIYMYDLLQAGAVTEQW